MVTNVDMEFWARDADKAVGRGHLIIMVDALRSGTSIVNTLSNGAKEVIPVSSLKMAYALRRRHPKYLLAGERGGRKPKGFDFGNSPMEFTSEKVKGKTLVMTTTSGTAALAGSRSAKHVLIGAFLNARAVARKAQSTAAAEGVGISFVLAGDKGRFSLEDMLCAGGIAKSLLQDKVSFSDKVQTALLAFESAQDDLVGKVMKAEHAKHLVTLELEEDIVFSCRLNVSNAVPIYKGNTILLLD